jgi:hypothetical protein
MPKSRKTLTQAEVDLFGKLQAQMAQLVKDIEKLSAKAPDGPVSKFKLTFINEQLRSANRILILSFKPIDGFEEFDDVSLPSSSDVVMVLAQYLACLERWRSSHVRYRARSPGSYKKWVWDVDGAFILADPPKGVGAIDEEDEF